MNKLAQFGIAAAVIAVVAGGSFAAYAAVEDTPAAGESAAPSDAATPSDAPSGDASAAPADETTAAEVTAPGEVCDPHNLNDIICLAFYPDIAIDNMTSGVRAQEPLRSMSVQQKIALAHNACDVLKAGGSAATTTLVATTLDADSQAPADSNNQNIFKDGALAYCNDFINDAADGTDFLWTLNAYRDMGESAAKASFADGRVIQRP